MINNISWGSYLTVVALLVTGYYIVVMLLYFRMEMQQLLKGRITAPESFSKQILEQEIASSDPELFPEVHLLMTDLCRVIKQACVDKHEKDQLWNTFQIKLVNYQKLSGTAFQERINKYVEEECIKQCAIYFSEEEMNALWL